jgi:hypothetical protein
VNLHVEIDYGLGLPGAGAGLYLLLEAKVLKMKYMKNRAWVDARATDGGSKCENEVLY